MKAKELGLLKTRAFVNGQWISANGNGEFDVLNPATGAVIASVADLGSEETQSAIEAASAALPAWRSRTAKERSVLLRRWHDLIMENREVLAELLSAEQGKPLSESRGEVAYGASFVEWYAEEAKRVYGETIPTHAADKRLAVVKQPVGVVAAITPWNFPVAMVTRKCGPALAAGCTVVLKPSEETPLSALALAELAHRAGIPAGVLNVVTTRSASVVGGTLTSHPAVRKVSFTGSTRIGKLLMQQCAETVKKVSLELGGNAPFIVFDDADVDAAVAGAMDSKYRNTGQTCVCANRFFVQSGIYEEFTGKLAKAAAALKVGPAHVEGVGQGPLINAAAFEKVKAHVADALQKGARTLTGGNPHSLGRSFFEPTVLVDVVPGMRVTHEETFGPVAPVIRFGTEAEAMRLANDTSSGLAGYFYSRDIGRAWRVAEAMEVGIVGINAGLISNEMTPFGGIKESGLGREGGRQGIEEYLEIKYLCFGGVDPE